MKSLLLGLVALLVLIPIQNILAQFSVNIINLPEVVVLWKELLVFVLLLCLEFRIWIVLRKDSDSLKGFLITQWPQLLGLSVAGFGVFQSLGMVPLTAIAYGFRFELWFLLIASVVVSWLKVEKKSVCEETLCVINKWVPYGLLLVVVVSLGTLVFGNQILYFLGFGVDNSVLQTSPIINVIDGGGWNNFPRLSGGFSSPNHFAGYLLLVLPVVLNLKVCKQFPAWLKMLFTLFIFVAIGLSYARFAWLAVLFYGIAWLVKRFEARRLWTLLAPIPFAIMLFAVLTPNLSDLEFLPTAIRKPSSSTLHYRHTSASLEVIKRSPKLFVQGFGLGSSGPASRYFAYEDNPLFVENVDLSYKWTLMEPDITIPESWYLQVLLNGGLIYLAGYMIVLMYPVWKLRRQPYVLAGLLSIIIGNLALHIWENQTVAIFWVVLVMYGSISKRLKVQS